ncbi:transposase [Enterococcus gallinarum]|nr:transposase [Enterococcus gallinarum]
MIGNPSLNHRYRKGFYSLFKTLQQNRRKCGIKNEGQIIKNGSHKTKVQLLPYRATKTELRLVRTRFYCKECQSTFNAQTNLVDENCYLSKELKVQIALELAKNTIRKEIANRYFVSDVIVLRVLQWKK